MQRAVEDVASKQRHEDEDTAEVDDEAQDQRPEESRINHVVVRGRVDLTEVEDADHHEASAEHHQGNERDQVDRNRALSDEPLAQLERLDRQNLADRVSAIGGHALPSPSIRYL